MIVKKVNNISRTFLKNLIYGLNKIKNTEIGS